MNSRTVATLDKKKDKQHFHSSSTNYLNDVHLLMHTYDDWEAYDESID